MQVWVDADACPGVIKDILFRAAERARVRVTLVANQAMRVPASAYIRFVQVPAGLDVADRHIVERLAPRDLVITADIPLAAEAIEKGADVLSPRRRTSVSGCPCATSWTSCAAAGSRPAGRPP